MKKKNQFSRSILLLLIMMFAQTALLAQTATLPAGAGTLESPYLIANLNNLYWITQNSGKWTNTHYKQTADIDASSTSNWDSGKGFSPIGNQSPFFNKSSYDGQGYIISGLFINRPTVNYQAMFGLAKDGSVIKNITLTDVRITAGDRSSALVAATVTWYSLDNHIENCHVSGNISGGSHIGGLVGEHNAGLISNSSSACSITASAENVGGLVGIVNRDNKINNSYATGDIISISTSTSTIRYGGLVGYNMGIITNSYATVSIDCNNFVSYVGGFIGVIGDEKDKGTAINCYSTGSITKPGPNFIGGFIGENFIGDFGGASTVTNCFWDTETSGQATSAAGQGRTTAQMKTQATFTNATWDFIGESTNGTADYWNINSAINNGYPYLMWQSGEYFAWTGTSSTAVNVASNWSSNLVPSSTDNISISNVSAASDNFPVISNSETLSCNNLEILSGASLTIEDGGALLVNGTVSSAGTVTHNETLTGPVNTWHLISAPTPADISTSNFKPESGVDDFYAWHQTSPGTWVNYLNTTVSPTFGDVNITDNFVAGKGYLVAYNNVNPAKSFVGTPNSGTIGFTLKYDASNPSSAGSNLLGNPYTAYIDWNKADRSLLKDNYAYVYNPDDGGHYDYLNGEVAGAWLKPHVGFFVIAENTSNNQTFNFSPAMQGINTGKKDQNAEPQKLVLKLSGEQFYEQAILSINSNSTAARDRNDAIFMGSYNPNVPQLYSMTSDGVKVAINSLPTVTSGQSIALGMTFPEDGEYVFSANAEGFEQKIIYLLDKKTGTHHKLDAPVVLVAEAGQNDDQYALFFGPTGIEEAVFAEAKYAVAASADFLTILGDDGELTVELIDVNGRILYKNNHQLVGGTLRILQPSAKGLVLLKLTTGTTAEVHKVIVK